MPYHLDMERVSAVVLWVAPIVVALAAHLVGVGGDFVADDLPDIVQHPVVSGDAGFTDLLAYNYMGEALGSGANTIRPLATAAFAVEWAIFGHRPWLFHLISVLWFCVAVLVAQRFLRRYLSARWASIGSAVFAALAIHVDAVAMIANRPEVCSFVFALLALGAVEDRRPWWAVACYWIALLLKESAFPVPLVALGWLAMSRGLGSLRWRENGRGLAILGVAAIAFFAVRTALLSVDISAFILAADNPLRDQGMGVRLWMPFVLLGKYLWLTLSPVGLAFDYTYDAIPVNAALTQPFGWLGVGFAAFAVGVMALRIRRGGAANEALKLGAAALAAFFAWYSLFSNSVFLIVTLFAERLFFSPSFFLVAAVTVWLSWLSRRSWSVMVRRIAIVCAVIFMILQVTFSVVRTRECRDTRSLFAAQVAAQPDAVKGHLYYARALAAAGEHELAIWHLAVATAGRNRHPERFEAPAGSAIDSGLHTVAELVAPGVAADEFWPRFRVHVRGTLGADTAAALDAWLRLRR